MLVWDMSKTVQVILWKSLPKMRTVSTRATERRNVRFADWRPTDPIMDEPDGAVSGERQEISLRSAPGFR